jgi:hypothetical protein
MLQLKAQSKRWFFWLEIVLLTLFSGAAWWWIAEHAGGPLFSDELLYMDSAINHVPDPTIINRYFHIYLFSLFFEFIKDPLVTTKIFWGFLAASTGLLAYFNARLLSRSVAAGLAAMGLFYAQWQIFRYPGIPWAEFTLMFLVMLIVAAYILIPGVDIKWRPALFILLGLLFYLAFRTKETSLPLGIIFVGMGFLDGDNYDWRHFIKRMAWVLAGVISGLLLMSFLDLIMLDDIGFSFRLQNIREHLKFNLVSSVVQERNNYFLMANETVDMYSVFLLYLISGIFLREQHNRYIKLLYLTPLIFIGFLAASLLRGPGVMESRYLIPILPLLCILAAQIFTIGANETRVRKAVALLSYLVGAALLYFSSDVVILISEKYQIHKWERANYFYTLLHPAVLCVLLGMFLFIKRLNLAGKVAALLCLTFIIWPPLWFNYHNLDTRWAANQTERRFYPFIAFSDEIQLGADFLMGVSDGLPRYEPQTPQFGMLDDNELSISRMFNVYFQQRTRSDQFAYRQTNELLAEINQYTYVILSYQEWSLLLPEETALIGETHKTVLDEQEEIVLLVRQ